MPDFAFYNAGMERPRGWKQAIVVAPRRLLRRLQRPIFQRQEQINHDLHGQVEALGRKVDGLARELSSVAALGWDQVATARRLAALEDEIARLRAIVGEGRASAVPRPHVSLGGAK